MRLKQQVQNLQKTMSKMFLISWREKSKKARSKAQQEAFARMRARKAEIDAKKREEKEKKAAEKPIVLQEYVSSAEEEEQKQKPATSTRKKKVKKKKQIVYETESSSSDDEVVAVVKRRKAAKKKKKSNARVIFTDELDDSDDENDKSLEQQYVDVPRRTFASSDLMLKLGGAQGASRRLLALPLCASSMHRPPTN